MCTCVPEGWTIIRGLWEGYEGKGVKKAVHLGSKAGDEKGKGKGTAANGVLGCIGKAPFEGGWVGKEKNREHMVNGSLDASLS